MTVKGLDSSGLARDVRTDDYGRLEATLGTKIAGENLTLDRMQVAEAYSAVRITGSTLTTEVKGSPGIVARIIISAGASGGTVEVRNDTTTLAVIPAASPSHIACELGIECSNKIIVVRSAQAIELTVIYR